MAVYDPLMDGDTGPQEWAETCPEQAVRFGARAGSKSSEKRRITRPPGTRG